MSIGEWAQALRIMWEQAPDGGKTPMFHLFGIKYADELQQQSVEDLKDLCRRAGLRRSMGIEVKKGVVLAKYVDAKPRY